MKKAKQTLVEFFNTTPGMIVIVVVAFYLITFLVYYFYSPGPEERNQALVNKNFTQASEIRKVLESTQEDSSTQATK